MRKMIVQFNPDGSINHTLKDSFINPAPGQTKAVERISIIEFSNTFQGFYVEWMRGPLAPYQLTHKMYHGIMGKHLAAPDGALARDNVDTLIFDTYENAVAAEIAVVEKLRETGETFA